MSRRAKLAISTIVAAILSGGYWLLFFLFAEAFTASDYAPGYQPSAGFLNARIVVVLVGGPLIFAALILLWRLIERRLIGRN
jgi:hypothetical protein